MEFQDKILSCVDCGAEFVWTAGEQLFFADKNFKNEPKRCKSCKEARSRASSPGIRERVETTATCSACGKETTVPFARRVAPCSARNVSSRKFAGAGGLWSFRFRIDA